MKQVVQNLRTGVLELLEVPCPCVSRGHLLIQSRASLISAGTERSLVEFGKASLIAKARQQPERVKQVLDKIKSDGLLPTLEAVFRQLDEPIPLGYCNAGVVLEVGSGVTDFAQGDRVASNGPHAETVHVPVQLCAKIPPQVDDAPASFAVLGSIALQGVRLLGPALGETVAVYGLGLVGLLAVQMFLASGVRVLGIDLDRARLELAERLGAVPVDLSQGADPIAAAKAISAGHGVDGVLITASAKNDAIVTQSAQMSRKRGRIVLVGVVNLDLNRADFYEKELSFQVSCSYGPGRYDPAYEQKGIDYPYPYVRWTEQRNIQAVLQMMAADKLDMTPLITSHIPHNDAGRAYELLSQDRSQLGIVLEYSQQEPRLDRVIISAAGSSPTKAASKVTAAVIGAGMFTKGTLLPALQKSGANISAIASAGGVSAAHAARKFGIPASTSDYRTILDDETINTVFITTRHNTHAAMVIESLQADKHVFVEKPLAITPAELDQVREAYGRTQGLQLMVGFNRRFSPHARKIKQLLTGRSRPVCMTMTVNAGYLPRSHWGHDPEVGGGRILGEACHWIDLMSYLAGAPIVQVGSQTIGDVPGVETREDHMTITLALADGSLATVHYFANGHRAYAKETLRVFSEGRVLELDNFRLLRGYGWKNFKRLKLFRQDKGHLAEVTQFVQRVASGGEPLIMPQEIWNASQATFAATEAAARGTLVDVATKRNQDISEPQTV